MAAKVKAIVSAFAGLFGSITAIYYGYASLTLVAGLATFLLTLMIQYSSVKIKLAMSLAGIAAVVALVFSHHGGT